MPIEDIESPPATEHDNSQKVVMSLAGLFDSAFDEIFGRSPVEDTKVTEQYQQWDQTRRRIWPDANHNHSASYVGARRVAWAGNEHEAGGESRWIATPEKG